MASLAAWLFPVQGRRKINNWGSSYHIFVFCQINFFYNRDLGFKIDCFNSL